MKIEQTTYVFDVHKVEIEKVTGKHAPLIRIRISADGDSDTINLTLWAKGQALMPDVTIVRKDERITISNEEGDGTQVCPQCGTLNLFEETKCRNCDAPLTEEIEEEVDV